MLELVLGFAKEPVVYGCETWFALSIWNEAQRIAFQSNFGSDQVLSVSSAIPSVNKCTAHAGEALLLPVPVNR